MMTDSYLWDRDQGKPDPFIVGIERALASKRYTPPRRRSWRLRGGLALLALTAAMALVAIQPNRNTETVEPKPSKPTTTIAHEEPEEMESLVEDIDQVEPNIETAADPAEVTMTR